MRRMGLTLLAGPANAGKVETLLERYLDVIERDPVLIVPNRSDVDRVERDLLRRRPALLGGAIGTFDDVFEGISRASGEHRPVVTETQRWLLLRRVVGATPPNGLAASARFGGFADSLGAAVRELEGALLEPGQLAGALADLFAAYRAELDRLELWDGELERAFAADRIATELAAWDRRPVFAYGFEDLTTAQWRLLEALAARGDVTVSLPYEPGRPAFASLERTAADLAALASGRLEELAARYAEYAHPALAHLERTLFAASAPGEQAPVAGAVHWLEGAGARGALELVGDEILTLLRSGMPADEIVVVCPSLERLSAPIETAFATFGIPYAIAGRLRLGQTAFGHALLSLLRFEWAEGGRRELYSFLRSPYSALARSHVDFLEGRLRGRAIRRERVEEETVRLRSAPVPALESLRAAPTPVAAVRALAASMARAAHGLEQPPTSEAARLDLRVCDAVARLLAELDGWQELAGPLSRDDVLAALERATLRAPGAGESGRVSVVDLLRARTGRFEVVFVLGLEEGTLPRRAHVSPFLDDDERRRLDEVTHARLARPDAAARDRYLFYAACTRATRRLVLVREAATDDGGPREPSPFWDETRAVFVPDEVARWTRRRPLSALTWPLDRAPTERERLRAVALLAGADRAAASELARANGWDRRLERALAAFSRRTQLRHPSVVEELRARTSFNVTELEAFADCSSIWFIERLISPRSIDADVDPKLRGGVAHQALYRFFSGLPKHLGVEHLQPDRLDDALAFLRRCLDEALAGVTMDLTELQRLELEGGLWRDLEAFVRAEVEAASPFVARRFEVSFGSERSAPELQRGLDLGSFRLSGKIDRIDVDPFSARGIVHDYKSGKTAHSAAKIEQEQRLQIPLYMLVLRDLVGIEPLGGVYRALAGRRETRGLVRAEAREDGVPEFHRNDYLAEDAFWAQVETAQERARGIVARIRAGDVRHDPRFGDCPDWCSLWPMCRVRRA